MVQIIRVYSTEASAIAGSTTNMIVSQTVDGNGGAIANLHTDNDDIPYFIYNRYFYRIDANEPVSEFHIDWDDGENNSPEKRNIQIIKNDKPVFYTVVEHIYTEACTEAKKFFPLVRVKSTDGFLSKWYTNDASENMSHDSTKALETFSNSLGNNQNLTSVLSFEKAAKDLIPHFCPSNKPPVAVLKVDRKRIMGGIDNKPIDNLHSAGGTVYPLLYAFHDGGSLAGGDLLVKLTVQGKTDKGIREYTLPKANIIDADADLNTVGEIGKVAIPYNIAADSTDSIEFLLRAELLNAKTISDSARIYIKVFNAVTDLSGSADVSDDATICVLSNGNPIIDLNEPAYSFMADTSESFSKASNIGIKNTYLDDDSLNNSTIQAQASISSKQGNISDEFHDDLKVIANDNSYFNKQLSYVHSNLGHVKDSDGRFYDFHRLIRAQVRDDYTLPTGMGDISNRRSFVEHYDDDQYESTVTSGPLRITTDLQSRGLLMFSNNDVTERATWHDLTTLSRTNALMVGGSGTYTLRYAADTTYTDQIRTMHPKNHILLCKTDLFDRVYFRLDNTYIDSDTASSVDITAMYSHEDGWKPLEIQDGTLGLKTSGGIKFKVPPDWKSMKSNDIESDAWSGPIPSFQGEITDITINTGDSKADIRNVYIRIYLPDGDNYIYWFNVAGESQPSVGGATGYVEVDITAGGTNTDEEIAAVLQPLIDGGPSASGKFGASVSGAVVTVTNLTEGNPTNHDTNDGDGDITFSVVQAGDGSNVNPTSLWDFDAYAVLISINAKASTISKVEIKNIWPFNNSHSQLIKIIDGHYVSLNDIAITQAISFSRSGKFVNMDDRFGKTEVRKLGAVGGAITFGSVDLGDTDAQGNRKQIKLYQQNATPVFLDVTHKSGEITRFYGVITSMSESHPTGGAFANYNVSMIISYIVEMDSTGALLSDKISIGGNISDTRQYVSTT